MNDEELSDDEYGGYLPCEEMETCEDLVPCEEIPNQEYDVQPPQPHHMIHHKGMHAL